MIQERYGSSRPWNCVRVQAVVLPSGKESSSPGGEFFSYRASGFFLGKITGKDKEFSALLEYEFFVVFIIGKCYNRG